MTICAGNRESWHVCTKLPHRFVLTAFQQCCISVYNKNRIALSCFACPHTCLQPGHRHDCTPIVHHVKLNQLTWRFVTCTNAAIWLVPHFFLRQLAIVLIANVTRSSPARKRERGLGMRLVLWWNSLLYLPLHVCLFCMVLLFPIVTAHCCEI